MLGGQRVSKERNEGRGKYSLYSRQGKAPPENNDWVLSVCMPFICHYAVIYILRVIHAQRP